MLEHMLIVFLLDIFRLYFEVLFLILFFDALRFSFDNIVRTLVREKNNMLVFKVKKGYQMFPFIYEIGIWISTLRFRCPDLSGVEATSRLHLTDI